MQASRNARVYPLAVLLLVSGVVLLACGESNSSDRSEAGTTQRTAEPADTVSASAGETSSLPPELEYEVIGENTFQDERRSLDVRLSRKVDENVLETLAHRLRERSAQSYARTFIVYYLPGMEVDAGGWATSHFDPSLKVAILGVSDDAASRVEKIRSQYGQDLIGVWENNQPGSASTFALFETTDGFGLEQIYPDGSSRTLSLCEESSAVGRRFQDPENEFGEYWLLRQDRLELHDPKGVVFVAQPVSERDG